MTLTPQKIAKLRRFEGLFNLSTSTAVQAGNELIEALPDILDAADKLARLTALLEPLRPLEAKATPGPWAPCVWTKHREIREIVQPAPGPFSDLTREGHSVETVFTYQPPEDRQKALDVEYMTAARNALPEMLRVVGSSETKENQ